MNPEISERSFEEAIVNTLLSGKVNGVSTDHIADAAPLTDGSSPVATTAGRVPITTRTSA